MRPGDAVSCPPNAQHATQLNFGCPMNPATCIHAGGIGDEVKAAFDNAKGLSGSRNAVLNGLVDFDEFNQFLADLKRYFYDQFVEATRTAGDGRLDRKEFNRFVHKLGVWGVDIDPAVAFKSIDDTRKEVYRNNGVLQWREIASWLATLQKDFQAVGISQVEATEGISITTSTKQDLGFILGIAHHPVTHAHQAAADEDRRLLDENIDLSAITAKLPCGISSREIDLRSSMWDSLYAVPSLYTCMHTMSHRYIHACGTHCMACHRSTPGRCPGAYLCP